jgi:hypothetical protein
MESRENELSSSSATSAFGTNLEFQRMLEQHGGHTSVQSSASNFGGAVGIQQLPNDANSQLLEQMRTLGRLSFGGSSSAGNNLFVTTAKPLSANTTVNTMAERPRKKQKVQSHFSFKDFEEDESTVMKNMGMERLDLGAANADDWTPEAKQCYDLVHILFLASQKPDSESVANAFDEMLTTQFNFGQSTERNAAYPFAAARSENVQLELRDFFDDEEGGLQVPAQKM